MQATIKNIFIGRIGRLNFFLSWLLLVGLFLLVSLTIGNYSPDYTYYAKIGQVDFSYVSALLLLILQILYLAWWIVLVSLVIRRLHDLGYGGAVLILLVPLSFVPIVFVFINLLPSKMENNKYGNHETGKWSLSVLFNKKF